MTRLAGGGDPGVAASLWRRAWWAVGLVLLLQFVAQAMYFPWTALNDNKRLVHIDSAFHQYQMEVARQLCAEGRVSGYEPGFAAGQGAGLAKNPSAKLQAVFACVAGSADRMPQVYKQISFWQGVAAPALVALAAVLLGLNLPSTAGVAVLAFIGWWTGGVRWYHTAGMVSYVIAIYLTLPFVVLTHRACLRPSVAGVLSVAALAAVGMWIHPLFPLGAALAGAVWFLMSMRSVAAYGRLLAVLGVMLAAMLVVNMIWLGESLHEVGGTAYPQPYQREVNPLLPLAEALGRATTAGGGLRLAPALVAGTLLCLLHFRGAQRQALVGLSAGGVLVMAWAAVGALIPFVGSLQPNRFSSLAWLCLVIPAGAGAAAGWQAWGSSQGLVRVRLAGLLAVMTAATAFGLWEAGSELFSEPGRARYAVAPPEVKGLGPVSKELVDFLTQRTDSSARVLFETSMARVHDGAHMAGLLGQISGREIIGGPYPHMDFASAWDGFALGAEYKQHTPEGLVRLLDAYNVRWMLCHSVSCKAAMRALPETTEAAQIGPVTAFERRKSPGFVLQGTGRVVESCVNRVRIEDASGAPLVLRYHWIPGLRSEPSGDVQPIDLVPGARPFVSIRNPPPQLVLRVGQGPGLACGQRAHVQP